ncbi:Peptidyl-prolyl isomerase cwc27 [Lecanora helva]
MSALYNLEPQPTAKVLLNTTSGDLILELFAKQTPLASRSFLQHCIDGYYEGTIFHRLVPGFILQGGDPTGTGHGGEAVYPGGVFEDEFHSRLKFNRRGLLGMANGGGKNDNGSQFFLTLGETRELQDKHTMFGRIVGDTIYNLMKMGEADLQDVEGGERPLYPTKILGCEVLVNPFDDMIRREPKARAVIGEKQEIKKKNKKKGGKTLLSFGGVEGEDGEVEPVLRKDKFNSQLFSENGGSSLQKEKPDSKPASRLAEKSIRRRSSRSQSPPEVIQPNREMQLPLPDDEKPSRSSSSSIEPEQVRKVSNLLDKTNAQIADLKASMKRTIHSAPVIETRKKSALEQMIPENATRGRKRKHGINGDAPADKQALSMLNAFKARLESAPKQRSPSEHPVLGDPSKEAANGAEKQTLNADNDEEATLCDLHFISNCQSCQSWDQHAGSDNEAQDDDNTGWMSHALNFEKDRLGKDLTWRKKAEEELVVIDPREKEKGIKEEQRAKKKVRMGGKKAWDLDHDKRRMPEGRSAQRT